MEELKTVGSETPEGTRVLVVRGDKIFQTKVQSVFIVWNGSAHRVKVEGLVRHLAMYEVFLLPEGKQ